MGDVIYTIILSGIQFLLNCHRWHLQSCRTCNTAFVSPSSISLINPSGGTIETQHIHLTVTNRLAFFHLMSASFTTLSYQASNTQHKNIFRSKLLKLRYPTSSSFQYSIDYEKMLRLIEVDEGEREIAKGKGNKKRIKTGREVSR